MVDWLLRAEKAPDLVLDRRGRGRLRFLGLFVARVRRRRIVVELLLDLLYQRLAL